MNLPLLLYLADVVEGARNAASATVAISFVGALLLLFIFCVSASDDDVHISVKKFSKYVLGKAWITVIAIIMNILIPSKTTMYMMIGTSYLADSKIPVQVSEILDLKLKDILDNLKKENK